MKSGMTKPRSRSNAPAPNASYNQNTFYEVWRLTIQRYGIYNPYTGRGVIKGLLPHGPHNVRDVLATHILKQTGSYEQASYAIQDTPDMVAKHYGRFLPEDKAAIARELWPRPVPNGQEESDHTGHRWLSVALLRLKKPLPRSRPRARLQDICDVPWVVCDDRSRRGHCVWLHLGSG